MAILACAACWIIAYSRKIVCGSWPNNGIAYWSIKCVFSSFMLLFRGWPFLRMTGINNPTWYLCVLLICYFYYYLVQVINSKRPRNNIFCYSFMIIIPVALDFLRRKFSTYTGVYYGDLPRGMETFFLGSLLAELLLKMDKKRIQYLLAVFSVGFVIVCICHPGLLVSRQRLMACSFIYPALIMIAYLLDYYQNTLFEKLGQISFEMFLWHTPVMLLISVCSDIMQFKIDNSPIIMLAVLALTVALSFFFFKRVEIPIKIWIAKISEKTGRLSREQ